MKRAPRITRYATALLAAGLCCAARGDGIVLGPRMSGIKPTIPSQRAFLMQRGGVETMIVESSLDAPAGDYAWVVPVPSVPRVDQGSADALRRLDDAMAPTVDNERRPLNKILILFAAAAALLAASAPLRIMDKANRTTRLAVEIFFAGFVCLFMQVGVTLLKEANHVGMASVAGVAAKADAGRPPVVQYGAGEVGSYHYAVVSSPQVVDLMNWLRENGFALPREAEPAVQGYVRRGWKFFAARLRHDAGSRGPHPIRLAFACDRMVYPMALTTSAGGSVTLDLYAVGFGVAHASGMTVWRAVRLNRAPGWVRWADRGTEGPIRWQPVSHPDLDPYFWDGAVLTRLRGIFPAGRPTGDLAIGFDTYTSDYAASLITREVAEDDARFWGLLGFCALVVALSLGVFSWRPTPGPMWLALAVALLGGIAFGLARYRGTDWIEPATAAPAPTRPVYFND